MTRRTPAGANASHVTDLGRLLRLVWRDIAWIAGLTAAGLLLALVYLSVATPSYSAGASLFIDPRTKKIVAEGTVQGGPATDTALVESQVSIIASDTVLRRVVDKLKLAEDDEFAPPAATGVVAELKALIRGRRTNPDPTTQAIESLAQVLKVKRAQRTYIVDIEVSASTAMKAAQIANAITDAYILDQAEAKAKEAQDGRRMIDARLGELREKVRIAETRVDEFKKANKILTSEGAVVAEQELGRLNTELATARAVAAEAKARLDQTKDAVRSGAGIETLPEASKSGLMQRLREQYAQVARREASLRSQLQPRHPVLIEVRSQLAEIRAQIDSELKRIALSSKSDSEIAARREKELLAQIDKLKKDVSRTNTSQIKLREYEQEADATRELLRVLLTRAKEMQEQEKIAANEARVISPAAIPSRPAKPSPWLVLTLGLAGGLGAGLARTLLSDHLENTRSRNGNGHGQAEPGRHQYVLRVEADEPQNGSTRPATRRIATIAPYPARTEGISERLRRRLAGPGASPAVHLSDLLAAVEARDGGAAPAYRDSILALHAGLRARLPKGRPATVLAISAERSAGTTATALGVAYAAALAGERVLLVDAASCDPELSRMFAKPLRRDEVVVLDNKEDLLRIASLDARSGLTLLPIALADLGHLSPAQLRRLGNGISALASGFDLVLVDGGALVDGDAVLGLAPALDGAILVCRDGTAESPATSRAAARIARAGLSDLGHAVTFPNP